MARFVGEYWFKTRKVHFNKKKKELKQGLLLLQETSGKERSWTQRFNTILAICHIY